MSIDVTSLLRSLDKHPGRTVSELARLHRTSRQYVHNLVRKMEQDGLVRLADNPDNGQSRLVEIAEKGEEAFHEVLAVNDKFCQEFEKQLNAQDVDVACQVVEQIQEMMDSVLWEEESTGSGMSVNKVDMPAQPPPWSPF